MNQIAMLLLVVPIDGGGNGDGVDISDTYSVAHDAIASSSILTLIHSLSVHSSQLSFFFPHGPAPISLSIPSMSPSGQWGAPGLHQPDLIKCSCLSYALGS